MRSETLPMALRVTAGSSSGPRPLGESTEVPRALLCLLMLFIQGTASHSPELRPFEIPTKNDLKRAVTRWDALPAPSLPAVGEEGHRLPPSNFSLSDFAPLTGIFC